MRSVLVTVPVFSGQAEAGSTTSASHAVSVRKMSCTTRCSSVASACAGVVQVRVGHRRVLAHDVHALDACPSHERVHDLHHGEAGLGVELRSPVLLEARVRVRGCPRAGSREHHRDQPRVEAPCTLFWPRSGMQARAGRPIWPVMAPARSGSARCRCRARAGEMPMPHRIIEPFDVAKARATSRSVSAGMPHTGAIARADSLRVLLQRLEALVRWRMKSGRRDSRR
jgi:hypothetical protein